MTSRQPPWWLYSGQRLSSYQLVNTLLALKKMITSHSPSVLRLNKTHSFEREREREKERADIHILLCVSFHTIHQSHHQPDKFRQSPAAAASTNATIGQQHRRFVNILTLSSSSPTPALLHSWHWYISELDALLCHDGISTCGPRPCGSTAVTIIFQKNE
mmetsp:Transcript_20175/g.55699  ORF Transcript_20175/g.55699 Transcript_20175/m.55699 type:complete len:160 (+) Transcript_20175:357-836(+)